LRMACALTRGSIAVSSLMSASVTSGPKTIASSGWRGTHRVDISRLRTLLFRNALLCINGGGSNVLIILHYARLSLRIRTMR
jgi:hypothetical protein